MSKHFDPPKRGIVAVRADAGDPKAVKEQLWSAFEDFKAEHTKELEDLKKGMGDVVQTEKVDRINEAVGELQKQFQALGEDPAHLVTALDEIGAKVDALSINGGGSGKTMTAEKREHAQAFDRFFRKGVEGNLKDLEIKAELNSSSDPDGGYVVPEEMEQTIDRVVSTISALRRVSRVVTIGTNTYKKLVTTSGANSGWVGEKEARSETGTPQLSALEFPVKEIYANPAATQNLLDDNSVSIADWLAGEVDIEFAEQEGDAFVNGDGVEKPRGILGYPTVDNASYSWGNVGRVITGVDADWPAANPDDALIDLVHALKQQYRMNARWLMNDATAAAVRKLRDADNRSLWEPSTQVGMPPVLLGYAVETDDNMPDIASDAYPIAFADFQRAYLVVDRQGIRVLRDPFTNKPYVHFYTTKRVGGGIQNFEAIKLLQFAD